MGNNILFSSRFTILCYQYDKDAKSRPLQIDAYPHSVKTKKRGVNAYNFY